MDFHIPPASRRIAQRGLTILHKNNQFHHHTFTVSPEYLASQMKLARTKVRFVKTLRMIGEDFR
eukprot:5829192-Karenia_brevis.AAC.1